MVNRDDRICDRPPNPIAAPYDRIEQGRKTTRPRKGPSKKPDPRNGQESKHLGKIASQNHNTYIVHIPNPQRNLSTLTPRPLPLRLLPLILLGLPPLFPLNLRDNPSVLALILGVPLALLAQLLAGDEIGVLPELA